MAAKPEATPAAPEAAAATPAPAPATSAGGFKAWIPALAAVLLAPTACWAVAQFVLVPRLKQELTREVADASPAAASQARPERSGAAKAGEGAVLSTFKFENVVVNLSGTMGTRYLKTTFQVSGTQPELAARFEAVRPQLLDITISVLSSLSLVDLEEPGAKNVIREKLVNAYNQALGQRVAEQVFFSEFVVQ